MKIDKTKILNGLNNMRKSGWSDEKIINNIDAIFNGFVKLNLVLPEHRKDFVKAANLNFVLSRTK